MPKKYLIIKNQLDDFEKYYTVQMLHHGVDVWDIADILDGHRNILFREMNIWKNIHKKEWHKKIRQYDTVIIFEAYNIVPLISLITKKSTRLILWKWNQATPTAVKRISSLPKRCEIWTFNPSDAHKNSWHLNTQFYFPSMDISQSKNISSSSGISPTGNFSQIENISPSENPFAFFVGKDKGRYHLLYALGSKLSATGYVCDFHMLRDQKMEYPSDRYLTDKPMSYSDVLKHIESCSILIDLNQKEQDGLTVRVLEALFYEKKLITNNASIIHEPFFSKNNIFVLNKQNDQQLSDFLSLPYVKIDPKVKDQYTFDNWLNRFET